MTKEPQFHIPRPLFIVFDGMDGSGKTTQMRRLAARLQAAGIPVMTTAEPTDSPDGRRLREALGGRIKSTNEQLAAMFLLDRIGHNQDPESGIRKALSDGVTVLCDRYYYSSLAYQGGEGAPTMDWVARMNLTCPAILHPDLCLCFDLDPQIAMERITRGRDRSQLEIFETVEQQKAIRARFARVRALLGDTEPIRVIDAGRDEECVAEAVWQALRETVADASGA